MVVLRVLELFSGIGGLHWALKQGDVSYEVVGSMEINPIVIDTYSHNFPNVPILNRNLDSLTAEEINKLNVDAIIMSPPCQPFCRTGQGHGSLDNRSSPLNHILQLLPSIKFSHIFIENVQGFETSDAHALLIQTLKLCNFTYQQFLLSPTDLGIPNSRLRYYLIGKKASVKWTFSPNPDVILTQLPQSPTLESLREGQKKVWYLHRINQNHKSEYGVIPTDYPWCVGDILEPSENVQNFRLSSKLAIKYWKAIDIVRPSSLKSCCVTKAYFSYLTGTGSFLDYTFPFSEQTVKDENNLNDVEIKDKKIRYFSPKEVARLMCYPDEFKFPPNQTNKQRYRALGNSVNVYVVALILTLLLKDE